MTNTNFYANKNTKIRHRSDCPYKARMMKKNTVVLRSNDEKKTEYQLCKCCTTIKHHCRKEKEIIDFYRENRGMDFLQRGNSLYVKTKVGCWKIVHDREGGGFILFHRSNSRTELDFANPHMEKYHRQKDMMRAESIEEYLSYIHKHDVYCDVKAQGKNVKNFTKEKYRRTAQKREDRRRHKRIDYLFRKLEEQHPNYIKYSIG